MSELSPSQKAEIESSLRADPGRVLMLTLSGLPVVVKRQQKSRPKAGYIVLNLLAALFREPMLRAVPAPGGAAGQAIELARLRALHAAGLKVPEILQEEDDWFAMSFLGEHTLARMIHLGEQGAEFYWRCGLEALARVHAHGQCLSQGFSRNLIWLDGEVGFIDFEDDPQAALGLPCAQARDWLLFLFSSAHRFELSAQQKAEIFRGYLSNESPEVISILQRCAQRLAFLRHLPSSRQPWGHDIVALQAAGAVLHFLFNP